MVEVEQARCPHCGQEIVVETIGRPAEPPLCDDPLYRDAIRWLTQRMHDLEFRLLQATKEAAKA